LRTFEKTLFRYCCACGSNAALRIERPNEGEAAGRAFCETCSAAVPVTPNGVILFHTEESVQNKHFDPLYGSGHTLETDEIQSADDFNLEAQRYIAQSYLEFCRLDPARPIEGYAILDAACGTGWVTGALLSLPSIRNCRFHAFDISPRGPEQLQAFAARLPSASGNLLELSVQNAEQMRFSPGSFDVIIGSSVLHHFDNYATFLADCRTMLKPGGVATFGEPFALGYGLVAASLKIAQQRLGTTHNQIEYLYGDIAMRVRNDPSELAALVDKHLFFQSELMRTAGKIGFRDVEIRPVTSQQFHREDVVDTILKEQRIDDPALAEEAKSIYKVFSHLFDGDRYFNATSLFLQIIFRT
jgi:ubiquinone/menaquinone biosynthesis C-methylase UbiE